MASASAIQRLASLHPDTEIWWDSSPLVYAGWQAEQRVAWSGRPELLDGLSGLGDLSGPALVGSTTNPPLAWQAIQADRPYWESWAYDRVQRMSNPGELLWGLYGEVCVRGAAMLATQYDRSHGRFGHICGQVDPRDMADTDAMVEQAHRLRNLGRNIMIKMPATAEGVDGIRILSGEGISTTATLCFSVAQLVAVAEAAQAGYDHARSLGLDLTGCRSTAALMLGRMEDAPAFRQQADDLGLSLTESELRWAGVAVARKAYRIFRERGYETSLLCASMRLGPTIDGRTHIWHLEQLAGGAMVLTIFPNILASFMELYAGRPLEATIEEAVPDRVLDKLLQLPYFGQAFDEHGLQAEQYSSLPGVQLTGAGFTEAMDEIESFTRSIWAQARSWD